MEPTYSRKSITNSYLEKKAIENDETNGNEISRRTKIWTNIRENWDKYVYTFCYLYNYFAYVNIQNDNDKFNNLFF